MIGISPVDYTNLPQNIMQNDQVISINDTTQIDLQGQAASESDGHRHLTGTGGQLQFVRGAYASKGGKSFMSRSSVYERKGVRKSRIVTALTPGNIVTTPRTDIDSRCAVRTSSTCPSPAARPETKAARATMKPKQNRLRDVIAFHPQSVSLRIRRG